MKVAIEARGLSGRGGIRTYIYQLLFELLRAKNASNIEIWRDARNVAGQLTNAKTVTIPLVHDLLLPWWLNVSIQREIKRRHPDLVHFTKADVPYQKRIPTVVTIYDVIPLLLPSSQSTIRQLYWPKALARAVRQSDHILTISEASKRGIVDHLGAKPENITVTPLAVDTAHFSPTKRLMPKIPRPYILFVGQWDQKKNLKGLIHAFSHIAPHVPHALVIAGRAAHKSIDVPTIARGYHVQDRVIIKKNVSYDDLPALYSGADLFVFPSIIEGWGFPPHEAMACGTPVIVSNADPLPEVVGDAGIVVPFSSSTIPERLSDTPFVERLAAQMQFVLENPSKQQEMSERGVAQAAVNTWEEVAKKTLDVYEKVHTMY